MSDLFKSSDAVFSPCGKYRYRLDRQIEEGNQRQCLFIMLNPSTADASQDDPTIRRCIGFAKRWEFGRLVVCNLFGFRATAPADMKAQADPVGPGNMDAIIAAVDETKASGGLVICAWGTHGQHLKQGPAMLNWLHNWQAEPHALQLTAGGHPGHPLYISGDAVPVRMSRA